MARGVIFDVDGTLVNSVDLHAQAWQDAFRMFGHDIDKQAIRSEIGKGGDQLMPVFINKGGLKEIGKQLEKRRGDILRERYLQKVRAFPHVRDLFKRLREDGIKVALASSAKEAELAVYKRVAGIEDLGASAMLSGGGTARHLYPIKQRPEQKSGRAYDPRVRRLPIRRSADMTIDRRRYDGECDLDPQAKVPNRSLDAVSPRAR